MGLCNTLDYYSSRLEEQLSTRHIPGYHNNDDVDVEDSDDELEIDADYGEGEVLEWFGDFGDEDAPLPVLAERKIVDVTVLEVAGEEEVESEDSTSEGGDSDGSSWGGEEDEEYFSDSSVEEGGSEKD